MASTADVWIESINIRQDGMRLKGKAVKNCTVFIAFDFKNEPHESSSTEAMLLSVSIRNALSLDQAALDALSVAKQFVDDASKELQRAILEFEPRQSDDR